MGDVVLGELIQERSKAREQRDATIRNQQQLDVYVVIAKEERRGDALTQIQLLRNRNFRVDFPLVATKVPKQFQMAEQLGARVAILFGDEWPNLSVKTLRTGEQISIPHSDLLSHLESLRAV
jgi:histidyl-tRNA synthetase